VENDFRMDVAKYYDYDPRPKPDIAFYRAQIPSAESTVLELGCGTGRVLIPLISHCSYIHGIDSSDAMLQICRGKLQAARTPKARAIVQPGDITQLSLGRTFDLIIAPFHVFQVMITDEEVAGFFQTVRRHLSKTGTCFLNVVKPLSREKMATQWVQKEALIWETPVEDRRVTCHERRLRIDPDRQVVYAELVYRRYHGKNLEDETVQKLVMRYYYPEQFEDAVTDHGFDIAGRWGGYQDEIYDEGQELVLQFR